MSLTRIFGNAVLEHFRCFFPPRLARVSLLDSGQVAWHVSVDKQVGPRVVSRPDGSVHLVARFLTFPFFTIPTSYRTSYLPINIL